MDEDLSRILERVRDSILAGYDGECCSSRGELLEPRSLEDFERLVSRCRVSIIFFYSPTCPYCRSVAPHFVEASEAFQSRVSFVAVNVAETPELAAWLRVFSVPTIMVFIDSKPAARISGVVGLEGLERIVRRALAKANCSI
ncbi:MAG: thioredoxin family protein [Desulfurococcales archaeon]|nr:thioredoxin family protein [Desulfurococcales archaeon]